MSLVKSDVQAFGVLLLRLFCRRSAPEDDESLIQWARPLVLEGAFPELLDDDSKDYDPYGVYTVFCAAAKCTSSRPDSRPCMSDVISILKQERFCEYAIP
ncbi:probable serine/threonine-protein kinase PBL1 [Juglans microcarpa x Juglans regia]|uniref:probable serine/threonine-protein kinase PBL1 n=1 Tax=Juglans microcarpa x Juglans regia TaxID=2249226 RepID=UPI001B7F066D|nr:probable serine/threonine-protein kinase PBL1 [Juglans microcarpa x Juglans regia]